VWWYKAWQERKKFVLQGVEKKKKKKPKKKKSVEKK
jgi:hypothetical protein